MRSEPTSDEYFDAASSGGDIERLYRSYKDRLRRYVAATFGTGPPDPEDVVQVAFENFAGREDRETIVNPEAFLTTSARNYVLDQRRRLKVRADHADGERIFGADCDDLDAERVLSARERWKVLENAIQNMDPRRREILIMNRIHGLSYAEIARRIECSQTLVKMLAAQALVICERALREADGE